MSEFSPLAAALRERIAVIGDAELRERDPEAHLTALQAAFDRIQTLGAELRPQFPPRLKHFMEQGSYDKALAFIEGGQG